MGRDKSVQGWIEKWLKNVQQLRQDYETIYGLGCYLKGKGCFHSPVTRRLAPNSNADKPSDTHSQTPRR